VEVQNRKLANLPHSHIGSLRGTDGASDLDRGLTSPYLLRLVHDKFEKVVPEGIGPVEVSVGKEAGEGCPS
jgi:hypothetical protein